MNRPRTSPPLLPVPFCLPARTPLRFGAPFVSRRSRYLQAPFSICRLASPAPPSPSRSSRLPLSLFSTSSLSLTLNKKSLLIARNLWDSASPSTCVKFFFSIYFYTYICPLFSYTCVYTPLSPSFAFFSWNKLRVSASAPITVLSSQIIYIYVRIVVACRCWFDSKAEILFSLSSSVLVDSQHTAL